MGHLSQIASSTIQLFLFLMPGIIFSRFFYNNEFSREFFKRSFFELILITFLPSFLFIGISNFLIKSFYSECNFDLFTEDFDFLSGEKFIAHIAIWIFAGLIGYSFKFIVRISKLDIKHRIFRFNNKWHYLFSGEYFEFKSNSLKLRSGGLDKIEFRLIECIVVENGKEIAYKGIWETYSVDKNGDLDYIVLYEVDYDNDNELTEAINKTESKSGISHKDQLTIIDAKKILSSSISFGGLSRQTDKTLKMIYFEIHHEFKKDSFYR